MLCRRLQQVSNVLWRRNFARSLPEASRSIVGIFGLLVIGDFGQLPLVMASALLTGAPFADSSKNRNEDSG